MSFSNKSQIKFQELSDQVAQFLVKKYRTTRHVFTSASPFGQILQVIQNITQLIFFYIEDSITELNIFKANKESSIHGLARLTGHNPTRPISAKGEITLKFKTGAQSEIDSNIILIDNYVALENKNNSLKYFILLESNQLRIPKTSNDKHKMRIIQGEIESQTVISDGKQLQSYNFSSKNNIENNLFWIYVNGEQYEVVESLYDMEKDQKAVIVKTSITDGVDIFFGNDDFGYIPEEGSYIQFQYVKSDGSAGNIPIVTSEIEFEFSENGTGSLGEEIDFNEVFDIKMEKPIILGSDSEDPDLTRLIAGSNSRSLVLARPKNYIHFLSRYNQFSFIDAYTTFDDEYLDDDNVIYLFLIPDVRTKVDTNSEYFTTDINNFSLETNEKNAVYDALNESGRQIVTTEVSIQDPIIKKYVANIFLRIYDSADQITVREEVISRIGEYFLNVKRRDKVPKSDLIAIIEGISGVDSVNIKFVSKENEDAIRNGFYYKTTFRIDSVRSIQEPITTKITVGATADPNLGLDEFGDITIGKNELILIRGGWDDRNEVTYEDGISETEFSSVNVIFKEIITEDINTKIMNQNKQNLKDNL